MIRETGICQRKIIGLAINGKFKGFDVISGGGKLPDYRVRP